MSFGRRGFMRGSALTLPSVRSRTDSLREGSVGSPLEPGARARMEGHYGVDLSRVRIHDDDRAGEAAARLDARAFTLGRNIYYGRGELKPGTPGGDALLAHEVAHTIQQGFQASLPESPRVARVGSSEERAAETAAHANARPTLAPTPVQIARQPKGNKPDAPGDAAPEDKWKGTLVSKIIISRARGKCGFVTARGTLIGKVTTDLAPGTYMATPRPELHQWKIEGKDVKEGLRFDIDLTPANADPWTLSYPEKVPLEVSKGSLSEPKMSQDVMAAMAKGELDPLFMQTDANAERVGQPDAPKPLGDADDYEEITRQEGTPPKYHVRYRDGSVKVFVYGELTPKMKKSLQPYFDRGSEETFDFTLQTFPIWWSLVGTPPLFHGLPRVGGVRPYIPGRVPLAKPVEAPAVAPVGEAPVARPVARPPVGQVENLPARPRAGAQTGDVLDGPTPRDSRSPTAPRRGVSPRFSNPGDRAPTGQPDEPANAEAPKAGKQEPTEAPTQKPTTARHPALRVEPVTVDGKPRWRAMDAASGQEIGQAYYDDEGNLRMTINTENQGARAKPISGQQIHDALLEASGGASTPFHAEWRPALPNNLETFNGSLLNGKGEVDAAADTWTAARCRERGLTRPRFLGGKHNPPGTSVRVRDVKGKLLPPQIDTKGVTYESADVMFEPEPAATKK